jgi:hypothetical protein
MRRVALAAVASALIIGGGAYVASHTPSSHSAATATSHRATTSTPSTPSTTPSAFPPSTTETAGCSDRGADPDPACTPGSLNPSVTQANIHATICVSGYSASIRPPVSVSNHLKAVAAAEYGIANYNPAAYEGDHLISLELGGNSEDRNPASDPNASNSDDVSNFFDEPHTIANPPDGGSANKDKFENYLHRIVCSEAMPLSTAQREIATDWYRNWVAAGRPTG